MSSGKAGAERLSHLSLLIPVDRRSFIKLTAITGSTAALASCGSPENQVIRFLPDEELVPGVAEWKPSVCPQCGGGCGLTVRVMQADVETTRNGQAGVVRAGVAKKLEGATVKIARKIGEQDKLFGSVTGLDIAEVLAAQGLKIDRRLIHLPEPIKAAGQFDVEVRLHRDVTAKLKVEVVGDAQA